MKYKIAILKESRKEFENQLSEREKGLEMVRQHLQKSKSSLNIKIMQSRVDFYKKQIETLQAKITCINFWILELEASCENTDL